MPKQTITRRALLEAALATPLVAGLLGCSASDTDAAALATGDRLLDLVIVDANIITMDDARPRAEAVAIKNGRFIAVGSSRDIRALARPGTQTLSLRGKTVLPGLIDAHTHVASAGRQTYLSLDLGLSSIAAIKQAIKEATAQKPKGEWITGNQYDDRKTDLNRFITRFDIDEVSPDHPVVITDRSNHISIANSVALRMAGLTKQVPDPSGGKYDRDPKTGELTGVMRELAAEPVRKLVPPPTRADAKRAAIQMGYAMARSGLTTVHDAMVDEIDLLAYQDALATGELPIRIYALILYRLLEHFAALNIRTGFGNDMLRIGPVKMVADGACAGRTMRMSQPYVGRPDDFGILTMSQEQLDAQVVTAQRAGFQIGIHANGDVAIDMVLNAYEKTLGAQTVQDPRWRIEHCTLVNPGLIDRIKKLGVIPTPFCTYVYHHSDKWADYGEERLQWMFAHKAFLDAGIPVTGASDYIPGPFEPMMAFMSMVARKGRDGKVWGGNQRITIEQAIRCYTMHGAYASFEERVKGSITPGKLADLVVLGEDLTKVEPDSLINVPVEKTMVGGTFVWDREA
ncbi:MAG: amidohydrolase [Deltaproteobacteria bacterium]|nr:amidohydrolase [Deltaproteobacteria bacterium]